MLPLWPSFLYLKLIPLVCFQFRGSSRWRAFDGAVWCERHSDVVGLLGKVEQASANVAAAFHPGPLPVLLGL